MRAHDRRKPRVNRGYQIGDCFTEAESPSSSAQNISGLPGHEPWLTDPDSTHSSQDGLRRLLRNLWTSPQSDREREESSPNRSSDLSQQSPQKRCRTTAGPLKVVRRQTQSGSIHAEEMHSWFSVAHYRRVCDSARALHGDLRRQSRRRQRPRGSAPAAILRERGLNSQKTKSTL